MIPELAHLSLILAFLFTLSQAFAGLTGGALGSQPVWRYARLAAMAQLVLVVIAFVGLMFSFYRNDFSVTYVATHSDSVLAWPYRLAATWGENQGSILLWVLVSAAWTGALALRHSGLPFGLHSHALGVLGLMAAGPQAIALFTANPFARLLPPLADGAGLNALLKDPGRVMYFPLFFAGIAGLCIPFAFSMAALIEGRFTRELAHLLRPWALLAWGFLTLAIAVWSYGAYDAAGRDAGVFWNPVEHAAFGPWLIGMALLHALAAADERGALTWWTVLLAILVFALPLLAAFLVLLGLVPSVPALVTDPGSSMYVLMFASLACGASFALLAWRGDRIAATDTELTSTSPPTHFCRIH